MNKEIFDGYLLLPVDTQPDTCEVDRSEIRTQILLATASSALKGTRSFTHMLTEVRRQGGRLVSPPSWNYWWLCFHDDRVRLAGPGQTLPYLGNKLAGCFQPCLLVDAPSVLTLVRTSVLIRVLLFRGKQADAEAPVFPTESAAVSAHSECLSQQSGEAGSSSLSSCDIYSPFFAVFCPTTCLTQTNTSRRPSVACTARTAASSCLLLKVSCAFSSGCHGECFHLNSVKVQCYYYCSMMSLSHFDSILLLIGFIFKGRLISGF